MSGFPPGYDPGGMMGGGGGQRPAPAPARMAGPTPNGLQLSRDPDAMAAYFMERAGIDPRVRTPLTEFLMDMERQYLRPWLGAMGMTGANMAREAPNLIGGFADRLLGNGGDFLDWFGGSTGAFLGNPTFASNLAGLDPRQQAGRLRDVAGFADIGLAPELAQSRRELFNTGYGQYALGATRDPNVGRTSLLDFLANDPQYRWMLGR